MKKKTGRYMPQLVIIGPPGTGKTTLGLIGGSIWGLRISEYLISAENIKSPARLAHYLGMGTYPILFDNASQVFNNEIYHESREMLKTAVETTHVRGKHVRGEWRETPSLASISFTIDTAAAEKMDVGEKRRSVFACTSIKDWSEERMKEFNEKFGEKGANVQEIMSEIGAWITTLMKGRDDLLEREWDEMAEEILTRLYKVAGMELPAWIKAKPKKGENMLSELYGEQREAIIRAINEYTAEIMVKYGGREEMSVRTDIYDRIKVITNRKYPSAIIMIKNKVYIFKDFLEKLAEKRIGITSLKDLAELMGWEYAQVHLRKININAKAVIADPKDLESEEIGELE